MLIERSLGGAVLQLVALRGVAELIVAEVSAAAVARWLKRLRRSASSSSCALISATAPRKSLVEAARRLKAPSAAATASRRPRRRRRVGADHASAIVGAQGEWNGSKMISSIGRSGSSCR